MPSERSTGLTFAVIALIAGAWGHRDPYWLLTWGAIAAGLAGLSLAAPWRLRPLTVVWFRFGLLLHRIVSPLITGALFLFVILPVGLVMRLLRDPLRSRRDAKLTSYWIDRPKEADLQRSMRNQY